MRGGGSRVGSTIKTNARHMPVTVYDIINPPRVENNLSKDVKRLKENGGSRLPNQGEGRQGGQEGQDSA